MEKLLDVNEVMKEVWTATKTYTMVSSSNENGLSIPDRVVFIPPKLRSIKPFEGGSIIIISAPGAVGKTTFAKRTAFDRKALYWDLSKIKLGDNTFIGTIAKVFGAKNLSNVLASISKGEISIFFDAFDEAEIISGWEGVETFVHDVFENCIGSEHPNVVFFSRSETAEFLQMKLEDLGGSKTYSMYEIDYFDHNGAVHFIKEHLKAKGDTNYDTHKQPFEKAVENIFSAIGHGMNGSGEKIWDDTEIRSFIGYSPVLQTIGSFLHEVNYEEVAHHFEEQQSAVGGIEVIAGFIEELLKREQRKITEPLKTNVTNKPKDWDGWDDIYTPEEQVKTIISYLSNDKRVDTNICGASVPVWIRVEYMNAITQFLPNHPFLRGGEYNSPAFRDYCFGRLFNHPEFEDSCRRYLANGNFVFTPLFSYFYNKFNHGNCRGPHVGFIYESAASKLGIEESMLLTFIKPNANGKYLIEIINTEGHKSSNLELECTIDENNPLVFERRLHHATINISQELIIGRAESSVEVSDVDIRAKKLTIRAKECHLNCHHGNDIIIKSDEYRQDEYALVLKKHGNGSVQINWPNGEIFPWSEYYSASIPSPEADYEEDLYAIKRILVPFRKHGKNDFAKHSEFIENVIVKDYEIRQKMLDYLLRLKILSKNSSDNKYHLDENTLNVHGINWSDIKSLHLNVALTEFLKKFRVAYT